MELKGLFITVTIMMTVFVLLALPYADMNKSYSFDDEDYLSDNIVNYTSNLGNMQEDTKGLFDDSREAGSKDRTTEGFFDIVGSLVQGGKDVASESADSLRDSTEIIEDTKKNTSGILPAVIFTAITTIIFIIITFGLIRYLTGR